MLLCMRYSGVQGWPGETARYAHLLRSGRERSESQRQHAASHLRRRRSSEILYTSSCFLIKCSVLVVTDVVVRSVVPGSMRARNGLGIVQDDVRI